LNDPRTLHAAFIAETPIDEPRDDMRNIERLKSLVNTADRAGKKIAAGKDRRKKPA
jgi:deoxyribonuclease-4